MQFTRNKLRSVLMGAVAIGVASVLAACAGGATQPSETDTSDPVSGGVLKVGVTGGSTVDVLDPMVMIGDGVPYRNIFEPLVLASPEAEPVLRAAESIEPSDDLTTWTITLRKGMMFQDGHEATSADLVATLKHAAEMGLNGAQALAGLNVDGVTAVDEYTVTAPFDHPYSSFVSSLLTDPLWLIPSDFTPDNPVGSGPFSLVSYQPGQVAVLERFDDYYSTPAWLDGVEIRYFEDPTSQANALASGAIDAAAGVPATVAQTAQASGKNVLVSQSAGSLYFAMNETAAPFDDVRVRQALRLLVDREQINQVIYAGAGRIANDLATPSDPLYNDDLPQRTLDIAQAKSLLAEAGYANGLTVDLTVAEIQAGATQLAELFAQQAAEAGVTVNVRKQDVATFYGPDYFAHVNAFVIDYGPAYPYLLHSQMFFATGGLFNITNTSDAEYDELLLQAQSTADPAEQKRIADQMQQIEYDRGAYIVPAFRPIYDAFDPKVHGDVESVMSYPFNGFRFADLWIAP